MRTSISGTCRFYQYRVVLYVGSIHRKQSLPCARLAKRRDTLTGAKRKVLCEIVASYTAIKSLLITPFSRLELLGQTFVTTSYNLRFKFVEFLQISGADYRRPPNLSGK